MRRSVCRETWRVGTRCRAETHPGVVLAWAAADLRWALGTAGQVSPSRAVSQLENKQAAARSRLPLVPRLQEVEADRRHGNRQLTASWEGQPPASAFPGPLHRPGARGVIFHRGGGKGEVNKGPAFPQAAPGTASPSGERRGRACSSAFQR